MCRLLIQKPRIHYLAEPIARFRVHDESKTGGNMPACWQETIMVIKRYQSYLSHKEYKNVLALYHLRIAGLYFSSQPNTEKYWNRIKGVKSLLTSVLCDYTVVKRTLFVQIFIRALLPKICYRTK